MPFLLGGETFWVEGSHPDEGGYFSGMSANVPLCLPTKVEQHKSPMVTCAKGVSKASSHPSLWGELALSSPLGAGELKGKLAAARMVIGTEVPAELHTAGRKSPEVFV